MDIKRRVLITGLVAAVLLSGGAYAYTYTTGFQIINVGEPSGDVATSNVSSGQPDWNSVTDNLSENTTCGEVPTGDLYDITPNASYSGDILVDVYLTNAANLTRAYKYFNMKLYLDGSDEAAETPSYRVLSLENGRANFSLGGITSSGKSWTQTTQSDFEGGTLNQVDTTTSPDDVLLAKFTDNVTDSYDDQSKIASSANVTVSGGQVKLDYVAGGNTTDTLRPNAAGDDTAISFQYPNSGAHWDKVDDVTSDNWSTYIYTRSTDYQRDLYNIPSLNITEETINDVTVYFTAARDPDVYQIYAIPYEGSGSDGYIKTIETDTSGNITDTVIDSYIFDGTTIATPSIVQVSGDIYAVAYEGDGGDGYIKTLEIDSNSGNITDSVIDTLEFDAVDGGTPYIVNISGDVYAVAYEGPGGDGFLITVEIASNGQITDTVIDTLEFDTSDGNTPFMASVSGDIFAVAYSGKGTDGFLKTVEINSSGNITDTVIDTLEFDPGQALTPRYIHVSDNICAISYTGLLGDGFLKTVEIASNGQITDTVIDTLEFDTLDGHTPRLIQVNDVDGIFAIAYEGDAVDGFLKTVEIASNGQITDTVIDTLEFDTDTTLTPNILLVPHPSGNITARAAIKTYGTVYNGTEETITSSNFTTKSYQWTTNPNTGQPWTASEITALQIGVELKTGSRRDFAAATQVYVEVNYTSVTYYSQGTVTSVNLLTAKKAGSIDNFFYDASAIPSGTGLKVQYSTDNSTWYNSSGTPGGWDTLSQGSANISLSGLSWSGSNFYYHMEFTSDGDGTPLLDEIRVYFTTYYSSGDLTSSSHDGGDFGNWDWGNITFTINEPSSTDLKFQLRSASSEGGLSSATWYGPTGTGDYYTTSGTAIINSTHDGDRWIQYKAYFSGPDDATPTLSDITITYTVTLSGYKVEIIGGGYCLTSDNTSEWANGWATTPELFCEVTQR